MNRNIFNVMIGAIMLALSFAVTACDDDETSQGYCIALDTDQSSTNFNSNYTLQYALSATLTEINSDFLYSSLTEKEAKKKFASYCSAIQATVEAFGVSILPDTYCVLYLTHTSSDPDSFVHIAEQKITFTSNADSSSRGAEDFLDKHFYYRVTISNVGDVDCEEVDGLSVEYIEYRAGDSPTFTKIKMPFRNKLEDVTLKKITFKDDKSMWDWINSVKLNYIQRENVTIELIDNDGTVYKTWEVLNAWPKKVTVEGFKADTNTATIETMVLANEGITEK